VILLGAHELANSRRYNTLQQSYTEVYIGVYATAGFRGTLICVFAHYIRDLRPYISGSGVDKCVERDQPAIVVR